MEGDSSLSVGQARRGDSSRGKTGGEWEDGGEGGKERPAGRAKLGEGGEEQAARHRPVRRASGVGSGRENEEKVEVRKMGRGYGWGTTR